MRYLTMAATIVVALSSPVLFAADPAGAPKVPAFHRTKLPRTHAYQKTLCEYLGTLKAADFEHGVKDRFTTPPFNGDLEQQYRHHVLTLMLTPLLGTKRGMPSINAPGRLFTLAEIETPEAVMRPPLWPEPVAFAIRWDYAGNPYFQNKGLKLRTFSSMCIALMMLDELHEHAPETGGASRSDWLAPSLISLAYPYAAVRDVLPEPVRQAYLTGLRKMGERVVRWGLKGEEPNLDAVATVALWSIADALHDPKFTAEAEAFARELFADEARFHPAGYLVDRGGLDLGFAGQTHFFASWLALASDWKFAREAVEKFYRLRAHLSLPEPDGKWAGPSHFQTRYSAEPWRDQWEWGLYRDTAASLVTDEAAYLVKSPTKQQLEGAAADRAQWCQFAINENSRNGKTGKMYLNDEIASSPWQFRLWPSFNFPAMVSFAFDHYPHGAYAHRVELEKTNSPMLRSPFQRDETFVRDFSRAFTVARFPSYAAIVHSGPVGRQRLDDSLAVLPGPYGFGGGQLSAFWTPATGSVLLARRGGVTWDKTFDLLEDWQRWPLHAVSGSRQDGKIFTTARIHTPNVESQVTKDKAVVTVTGVLPKGMLGQNKVVEGEFDFRRVFTTTAAGVRVETTLTATGQDTLSELYETLPVYLHDGNQPKAMTKIECQVGNDWREATTEWQEKVVALKLSRFDGAVLVKFDRPRRVKLSASEWSDTYLSRAKCRNVLIDLLENADAPRVLTQTGNAYQISALTK